MPGKIFRPLFLLLTILIVLSFPKNARAGCTSPILPGEWHTKPDDPLKYVISITSPLDKNTPELGNIVGEFTITSDITLNVACDGSLTGKFNNIATDFIAIVELGNHKFTCQAAGYYEITAGKVLISNGQPLFSLDTITYYPDYFICDPGGNEPQSIFTRSYELQASSKTVNTITGTAINGHKDPFYDFITLINSNIDCIKCTSTVHWVLYNDAELPIVTGAASQYEQYFLTGIPADNNLKATVDWKQSTPEEVHFGFQGNQTTVPTNDTSATWPLNMALLTPGLNPVNITATDTNGLTSLEYIFNYHGVPVPAWATPANLVAQPQGDHLLYSGKLKFPAKPFSKMVQIPDFIPVIGGPWGIQPIQFTANLQTNSSGAPTNGPITGTGGLALGSDVFNFNTDGQVITQLTDAEMLFDSQNSHVNMSFTPNPYTKQIGLISLIPASSNMFNIPVVGDLLKAINSIFAINVTVAPKLSGKGNLGIIGNEIGFTSGQITSDLLLKALAEINLKLASAYAGGGGNGSLVVNVASPPTVANCFINLFFEAGAKSSGLFGGKTLGPYQKNWQVAQCVEISSLANKSLASPVHNQPAGALQVTSRPTDWRPEQVVNKTSSINSELSETTLVENANAEAGPALAINRDGRMALAWMSEDPTKPRQQALEIAIRMFDGKVWAEPIQLTTDDMLDTVPTTGFDKNGQVLTVWMTNTSASITADSVFDQSLAKKFELAYAAVDQDGKILTSGKLTDDDVFDFNPQIATGSDGSLWVFWQSSPSASMIGTASAPNQLKCARWNGKTWSKVQVITEELTGTIFWKAVINRGDDIRIVTDGDLDDDLSTASDREIFLYTYSRSGWKKTQITHNDTSDTAPMIAFNYGKLALAWVNNNQRLVGLVGSPSQEPATWLDEKSGVSVWPALANGNLLGNPGGNLTMVWTDSTSEGIDIWLSQLQKDGSWSKPIAQLHNADQRKSVNAIFSAGGDLVMAMARVEIKPAKISLPDGTSITIPQTSENADLLITNVPGLLKQSPQSPAFLRPLLVIVTISTGCASVLLILLLAFWYIRSAKKA